MEDPLATRVARSIAVPHGYDEWTPYENGICEQLSAKVRRFHLRTRANLGSHRSSTPKEGGTVTNYPEAGPSHVSRSQLVRRRTKVRLPTPVWTPDVKAELLSQGPRYASVLVTFDQPPLTSIPMTQVVTFTLPVARPTLMPADRKVHRQISERLQSLQQTPFVVVDVAPRDAPSPPRDRDVRLRSPFPFSYPVLAFSLVLSLLVFTYWGLVHAFCFLFSGSCASGTLDELRRRTNLN